MKKRPNIIFIMTDQQRYDTMGCVNPKVITPNLDKLIENSVFFENGRCSNPSCVPSRAGIMTGKFPSQCQVPAYISYLPDTEKTFMKRLKENGYYTAVVGKQHFAESTIDKGYDYEMIVDGHFPTAPKEQLGVYLDYLKENGIEPDSLYEKNLISGGTWKGDIKYHIDNFIGDKGKEWMENRLSDTENKQPWFFTLSFPGPHHPYDLEGTKYADMYELKDMEFSESTYEDLEQKGPQFRNMGMYSQIYLKDYTKEQFLKTKRSYYANITLIDEKIGEVLEVLKKYNAYDDTVIIYTWGIVNGLAVTPTSADPKLAFEICMDLTRLCAKYARSSEEANRTVEQNDLYVGFGDSLVDDGITTDQIKYVLANPDEIRVTEKIMGPANVEYEKVYMEEVEKYLVEAQDLETTIKNIKERADEAIKKASN